jgi:hypothetical protein
MKLNKTEREIIDYLNERADEARKTALGQLYHVAAARATQDARALYRKADAMDEVRSVIERGLHRKRKDGGGR